MAGRHDPGSAQQRGLGITGQVLLWGGTLSLLVGGVLAYPFVSSRLASPRPPTLTVSASPTATPVPTFTRGVPSATPTYTPTASSIPPTPTSTQTPSPTPTPAIPNRVVIPTIHVDAPVIPVSWETTEADGQAQAAWGVPDMYAAGWHETSAPLGAPGNTVLNGHNTTYGEVFRDLYTLEIGDAIAIYAGDAPYTYTITEILILPEAGQPLEVRMENARHILPTEDERVTLVTCHPYGSLRYRLIVIAHPATVGNEE